MTLPRLISIALLITLAAAICHSQNFSNFKARLQTLREAVDAAAAEISLAAYEDSREAELSAAIDAARQAIPKPEAIDNFGGSVETNFAWVSQSLDTLEAAAGLDEQAVILESLRNRLAAVAARVTELEQANDSGKTKDENKQRLAAILAGEEFAKPAEPEESLFARWWREFWEWVLRQQPEGNASPAPTIGAGSPGLAMALQILLLSLVAALIGFLLYRFYPFLASRFGGTPDDMRGKRVILGEQIGEEVSATDLLDEAERLAREGELRLAVRKGYIALLCELGDRRLVSLARHKTNRDYLKDLKKTPGLQTAMAGATANFEQSWYGIREVEMSDWEAFRSAYVETVAETRQG